MSGIIIVLSRSRNRCVIDLFVAWFVFLFAILTFLFRVGSFAIGLSLISLFFLENAKYLMLEHFDPATGTRHII